MSGYILCQVKRAQMPYYIENISMNIFTIEELCFYLHHNIYLLDETIINEPLCDWIRKELGLEKLYRRLYRILEENGSVGNFILPIFKEINFLTHQEFRELNEKLEILEGQPPVVRQKKKGDYLVNNRMYVNAIKAYKGALLLVEDSNYGEQYAGEIYHNMGCAYVNLFQIQEACECFFRAYNKMHTKMSLKHYLVAYYMGNSVEDWTKICTKMGADPTTREEVKQEVFEAAEEAAKEQPQREMVAGLLQRLTREYHRSTGF